MLAAAISYHLRMYLAGPLCHQATDAASSLRAPPGYYTARRGRSDSNAAEPNVRIRKEEACEDGWRQWWGRWRLGRCS